MPKFPKLFISPVYIKLLRFMKLSWLLATLLVSVVFLPGFYLNWRIRNDASNEGFFFGVSFGADTSAEAKLLIDRVKEYTNFFVVNSWPISTNETALNEVCEYAVNANLRFIVFFDFVGYPWHYAWLDTAKEKWGSNFLGIYLYDEPGGRQIDEKQWDRGSYVKRVFANVSDYDDAANRFVTSIGSSRSYLEVKKRGIPMFTSDYALYWFDYLAGYDCIFAELGWNHSRVQQIGLCRGAARMQEKQWGAIIVWTYRSPPYLENGTMLLDDMIAAYQAGAQYLVVFNYPQINPYGILEDQHFAAMEAFWRYTCSFPRGVFGLTDGQAAFVLPENYGWGMRNPDDNIWGFWSADHLSPIIWNNMQKSMEKHGLKLDIIYDDSRFDFREEYPGICLWNSTK